MTLQVKKTYEHHLMINDKSERNGVMSIEMNRMDAEDGKEDHKLIKQKLLSPFPQN